MIRLALGSLLIQLFVAAGAVAQIPPAPPPSMPRGLVDKKPGVTDGYVLFAPSRSEEVYLLDNDAQVVHRWKNPHSGLSHYLMDDGRLLRGARDPRILHFRQGGVTGMLQELAWNGEVLWQFELGDEKRVLHHDIEPLPNGNILALAWEVKTPEEARAAGRRESGLPEQGLMSEWILEIEPTRPRGGKIVWEWHVWDHLVSSEMAAKHPGRLDVNADVESSEISAEELAQLQALGYVSADATPDDLRADFLHANAIDYDAGLDQIAISVPTLGEIWIIDHSTTREEARTSSGGRSKRGGELLYRWGNPSTYGRGEGSPKRLFFQHDVRWIPEGQAGAGHLTLFNNGRDRPDGAFSSIEEIVLPLQPDGSYALAADAPFAPPELFHEIRLPPDRFAPFISGARRLSNGNTFVCAGTDGILLETNAKGEILWEYRNPYGGDLRLSDGSLPVAGLDGRPFAVFRAHRIAADHPALAGRTLSPLDPQPKVHPMAE